MKTTFHSNGSHTVEIVLSALLALGGGLRYLNDVYKDKKPFSWFKFILKIMTNQFVGLTVWSGAIGLGANQSLALSLALLSSWMGVASLELLWDILIRYLNAKIK